MRHWKNEYAYQRILEILDDYWITEPEVLTRLIIDEIERYLDAGRFNQMLQLEDEQTEELLALASSMD